MGLLHRIVSHVSGSGMFRSAKSRINGSVFFHEDNYCQLELVPVQNLLTKQQELEHVQQHAEKNFTGNGFLSAACRMDIVYPLKQLNIDKKDFKAIIKSDSLYYFDTVYTGYSTHRELKKNTRGFGFENYVLFYTFSKDIITACWIDYNPISETLNNYPEKLQHTLLRLGHTYGLVLIDWNECLAINLNNKHALCDYMKEAL